MSTKSNGYEELVKQQRERNVKMIAKIFETQLKPEIDKTKQRQSVLLKVSAPELPEHR